MFSMNIYVNGSFFAAPVSLSTIFRPVHENMLVCLPIRYFYFFPPFLIMLIINSYFELSHSLIVKRNHIIFSADFLCNVINIKRSNNYSFAHYVYENINMVKAKKIFHQYNQNKIDLMQLSRQFR